MSDPDGPVPLSFRGVRPYAPRCDPQAPTAVEDGRQLIFTGPSGFGSHAVNTYLRCPHKFALTYDVGRPDWAAGAAFNDLPAATQRFLQLAQELSRADGSPSSSTEYTKRGTLVHVGISHYYARMGCQQGGVTVDGEVHTDPDDFYTPEEACDLAAQRVEEGFKVLGTSMHLLKRYLDWAKRRQHDRVLAVETVYTLPLPSGHYHTARLDLVTQDITGMVRFVDHKTLSKPKNPGKQYTYALQILGHKAIGRELYGSRFNGVWINAIDAGDDGSAPEIGVHIARVPPVPALERNTVSLIDQTRQQIEWRRAHQQPPELWPRVPFGDNSWRSCARCPVRERCIHGT